MKKFSSNRRQFLNASLATTAVFGAERSLLAQVGREASGNSGEAKNVIFMVSDGMNLGALSLARLFNQRHGDGKADGETNWMRLYRERPVVRALMETYSNSSCVTDSAAAASAWGCGKRVDNGVINILPDGKPATTLHEKMRKSGRKTGLVTTASVSHATPAGFAANVANRGDEKTIAGQYLDRHVDLLLGGGQKHFNADLMKRYQAAGYKTVTNRGALSKLEKAGGNGPLLGIFSDGHMPYEIDRKNIPALDTEVPTLAEMSRTALLQLQSAKDGFFLMIEGARIDHAGHANDAAASIHDQLAFDDAIGEAIKFIDKNPDTLLVVTTDHGCGGIQMNGVKAKPDEKFGPGSYSGSNAYFDRLAKFNRSFEWMKQKKINALSGEKLSTEFKKYTGLTLNADQAKLAQGLKGGAGVAVGEHTGVGWTSQNHTGELVEFCAVGPGSDQFPAFIENRNVHSALLKSLGMAATA